MISQIRGRLASKSPGEIVVDCNGVGYGIRVPLSTFYELPELHEEVLLQVYTHVREDALHLYGFLTPKEKELFCLLIGISGVGPRLAINCLSGISARDLEQALHDGDLLGLTRIPGIGRKTAERMLVELKDKVAAPGAAIGGGMPRQEGMVADALSALINLGYTRLVAEQVVRDALRQCREELSLEELLKESLRLLARH
ncbi:MAG: Holliday junction DNA helicase RuvA [Deltaproteobacteria bacterium RBG_16_54_18]|nr:MAG: Holliday junction DNA helicase RuvA [Deltaproteobacteria bacterium RBG_16_54_18]